MLASLTMLAHAAASGASTVDAPAMASDVPGHPFVGDDPIVIRDTLARKGLTTNPPSVIKRIENLIHLPESKRPRDDALAKVDLDRQIVFVIPASYGVLYRSKTGTLSVDLDLAGDASMADEMPGAIVLERNVKGPSGRGLVVAPQAREKGFIQQVDLIELKADGGGKTRVHARLKLPAATFDKADGDFAIAVLCRLTPPYLTERHDHADPTDDEPTDITTRTSTLTAMVSGVWLVSPAHGMVLSKHLYLTK